MRHVAGIPAPCLWQKAMQGYPIYRRISPITISFGWGTPPVLFTKLGEYPIVVVLERTSGRRFVWLSGKLAGLASVPFWAGNGVLG